MLLKLAAPQHKRSQGFEKQASVIIRGLSTASLAAPRRTCYFHRMVKEGTARIQHHNLVQAFVAAQASLYMKSLCLGSSEHPKKRESAKSLLTLTDPSCSRNSSLHRPQY